MRKHFVRVRPADNETEHEDYFHRITELIDRNDKSRFYVVDRPLHVIGDAIDMGHLFLVEDAITDDLLGCFALYDVDHQMSERPTYELGTVIIDRDINRYRAHGEGILTYSIIGSMLEGVYTNGDIILDKPN